MAGTINILLYHLYDESLVYMAMKAGLNLCDIMYVPCSSATWEATKCNTKTAMNMTDYERSYIQKHLSITGEQIFYDALLNSTEKILRSPDIKYLTKIYREKKTLALRHCSNDDVIETIEQQMRMTKGVIQDKTGIYHVYPEKTNPLDPKTVCLIQHCMKSS